MAGATAARVLAQRGLRVLLAERKADPGALNYCAEAVSARSIAPFGLLTPDLIAAPVDAGLLVGPGGERARLLWPGVGYVLHRDRLMRRVFELAVAAGADGRLQHEVAALERDRDGTLRGVVLRTPAGVARVTCAAVLAADGIAGAVGRLAGIDTRLSVAEVLSSAQYRMTGVDIEVGTLEFWIGDGIAPGGYAWVFPRAPSEANVGVGIIATRPSAAGRTATAFLKEFRRLRFQNVGKISGYITGGIPVLLRDAATATQGVLSAGDALRAADPLSAAGIAEAMASARLAAETLATALAQGDLSARRLARAGQEYFRQHPRLAVMARIRRVFDRLDDQEKGQLVAACREAFHERRIDDMDAGSFFLRLLRASPRLLRHARHLLAPA